MAEENKTEGNEKVNFDKFTEKLRKNPWMVSTIVLAIFTLILLYFSFQGGITGNVISGDSAGNKLVDYLNSKTGGGVSYVSSKDLGNLYEITVSYKEQDIPVYTTKDGNYFIQAAVPITGNVASNPEQQEQPQEVPKSDKPKVELFIMSHCPYGTQAEKGLIPVIKVLGNKIDAKIRFVHYFMHGDKEEKETYNQLCIREEQSSKFLDYLACFLEDSNSARCLDKVGIDKTKLNSCLANKAKDYYASDSELSQGYGVQGSPSLVINGVEASSDRNSQAFLDTVCSAFNVKPEECSQTLSSANPSAGFGYSASSDSGSASCG